MKKNIFSGHLSLIVIVLVFLTVFSVRISRAAEKTVGNSMGMEFVLIPPGTFTMGSPEHETGRIAAEGPQHKVTVADFWMGQYEINWQQYELFVYRDERSFNSLVPAQQLDALAIDGVSAPATGSPAHR